MFGGPGETDSQPAWCVYRLFMPSSYFCSTETEANMSDYKETQKAASRKWAQAKNALDIAEADLWIGLDAEAPAHFGAVTRANARAELHGKNLCCWCALDQPCHADVLLEIANGTQTTGDSET